MVKKSAILIISAAAIFAAAFSLHKSSPETAVSNLETQSPSSLEAKLPSGEAARVLRAVDGDTIEVAMPDGGKEKVRYIGVNAPESVDPRRAVECFGKESSAANAALIEGRMATLVRDIGNRDKYGRLLRYVYVGDIFVNLELVRLGYAQVATYPPDIAHAEEFRVAERAAREAGRGLWSACR